MGCKFIQFKRFLFLYTFLIHVRKSRYMYYFIPNILSTATVVTFISRHSACREQGATALDARLIHNDLQIVWNFFRCFATSCLNKSVSSAARVISVLHHLQGMCSLDVECNCCGFAKSFTHESTMNSLFKYWCSLRVCCYCCCFLRPSM